MYFKKLILFIFIYSNVSCQEKICPENLKSFSIRNTNYEYNCGLPNKEINSKKEMSYICTELARMQRINFVMTNYNNGYMSIKYNTSNKEFFPDEATLVFTVRNGYIFKKGGFIYKNDILANHLINLFKIKNVNSEGKCN